MGIEKKTTGKHFQSVINLLATTQRVVSKCAVTTQRVVSMRAETSQWDVCTFKIFGNQLILS